MAGLDPQLVTLVVIGDAVSVGVLFPILVGLALALRRRPEAHKRLMLLSFLVVLPPALGRIALTFGLPIPFATAAIYPLLLSLAVYDFASRKRLHPATVWGGLLIVVSGPVKFLLARTDAARAIIAALAP